MNGKTVFVRTIKGEEEARSKTASLSGDIRRSLLMVDGDATFKQLTKRAAPSLRDSLEQMLNELVRSGFIQDKSKSGNVPNKSGNMPKMATPPKIVVPVKKVARAKIVEPPKKAAVPKKAGTFEWPDEDEVHNVLDFATGFQADDQKKSQDKPAEIKIETKNEAKVKADREASEAKAKQKILAKARQEAESREKQKAGHKATQEAERAAEEALEKARREAEEKARHGAEEKIRREAEKKATQEALEKVKRDAEEKIKRNAEEKGKREAEEKAKREAEEKARRDVEQKAMREALKKVRREAEEKAKREAEEKARREAEEKARREAEEKARREAEEKARREAEEKARREAEEKARREAEEKARREAEEKARREAEEKARREAEEKAKREAEEKARREAEEKARREAEEKARREAEEKARREAEEKARREAEEKAKREAEEKARREALAKWAAEARAKRMAESKTKQEAEENARVLIEAQTQELAAVSASAESNLDEAKLTTSNVKSARTTSATVLFFDVVAYTKQPVTKQVEVKKQFNKLVSDCLSKLGDGERIILDTGDGAAIGFLQHPEEALKAAMQFQKVVTANEHNDYPELSVRIGIHIGPISIVQDMNGLSNMVGDGINDAQRVMSFAGTDQIFISRSYYDFVSRLSNEYDTLFHYQGALEDKHGREHPVYKLVDIPPVAENEFSKIDADSADVALDPFSFDMPDGIEPSAPSELHSSLGLQKEDIDLMASVGNIAQPEEERQSPPPATSIPEEAETSESTPDDSGSSEPKPSTDDLNKLEAAQAKVWAEAEQRAKEASRAKAVWNPPSPKPQPVARTVATVANVKRKPFPVFKLGVGVLVLLLLILFIAPFVIPSKEYVQKVEQLLSERLHQPVYIEHLEGRILPLPRLDLVGVSIGEKKQIKISMTRLNFSPFGAFTATKSINSVELVSAQIEAKALQQTAEWLEKIAADSKYPVARILLHEGKLEGDGFTLSGIRGNVDFDDKREFRAASLHAEGNKYSLKLETAPLYKTRVSISVRDSALPLLPNWIFDDLTAEGTLTKNELIITELDGSILGGILRGDARLSWNSGWDARGSLVAKILPTQNIFKALRGDLEGTASFQMRALGLSELTDTATLKGSFVISKGVINGIDIIETTRLNSTENLPGGRTFFEELWGDISYAKDVYDFRNLKISAGVLTAWGKLNYTKPEVKGAITADLTLRKEMPPVPLELRGTRDNLILRAVR